MKISKSKQELARIISENGGWREMAKFSAQDKDGDVYHFATKPTINAGHEAWHHKGCIGKGEFTAETLPNWHQTILSREEYFFLHQNQGLEDALDEPTVEAKPTIEQLASDYRNAKDYANLKQDEADKANMQSDAALSQLEDAIAAIGFAITPLAATEKEPELVITDWRDLQVGDVISVSGKWWEPDSEYTVDENDGSRDAPIRVGDYWAFIGECSFKFISRP